MIVSIAIAVFLTMNQEKLIIYVNENPTTSVDNPKIIYIIDNLENTDYCLSQSNS